MVRLEQGTQAMTDVKALLQEEIDAICEEEGFREKVYKDHLGNDTFGHGLTWISEYESKMVVSHRVPGIVAQLIDQHPFLEEQPVEVVMILTHMAYQLGVAGVGKFRKMLEAIKDQDYPRAADEMLDSKWHKQTPNRANRLAERMRACKS